VGLAERGAGRLSQLLFDVCLNITHGPREHQVESAVKALKSSPPTLQPSPPARASG
jgi:hypothetical protein